MKPGEWIGVSSTAVLLLASVFTTWLHLETRMTGLQKDIERQVISGRILRQEVLDLIKKVNALEGQHNPHHKTPHVMPQDDEVMAETYPIESGM